MTERQPSKPFPLAVLEETSRIAVANRVRSILLTRKLTLYKASARIRADYPRQSSHHLPRNLYFLLRSAGWSPTIQQLIALSHLLDYRLADWLAVFGFRLDEISREQIRLRQPRTVLLDSTVYNMATAIPWFRERPANVAAAAIAPLSQLLERSGFESIGSLVTKGPSPYLYAKIGRQDAYAFPDLAPGSIVRADTRFAERAERKANAEVSKAIFLVEHSRGLCCCRLHFGTRNRITLRATELPFSSVAFELGSEARILGVLDLEVRRLSSHRRQAIARSAEPEVARDLTRLWTPAPFDQGFTSKDAPFRIRNVRLRAGLSLRQASEMSREIARAFKDRRYFASPGSLSDYEATNTPPRHIHKLFTLSILYSVRFWELLDSFGLGHQETGLAAIAANWPAPAMKSRAKNATPILRGKRSPSGFLVNTLDRLGELPLFLRQSLPLLTGLEDLSLRDVYWVGGHRETMHPLLYGALFVIVDRRKRRPHIFPRKTGREQAIYLLRRRDGSYLMASCSMEDGAIVLHSYTDDFVPPERLRKTADVDVIGEVVTVIRSLRSRP